MTSSPVATRRSKLDFAARSLQPTHVRTGMLPGYISFNCSERAVIPVASLPSGSRCRLMRPGRFGGVGADVNSPAGEPGRQPGVLPFLANGQRHLVVGNDD